MGTSGRGSLVDVRREGSREGRRGRTNYECYSGGSDYRVVLAERGGHDWFSCVKLIWCEF